jgi:hypothetical protein
MRQIPTFFQNTIAFISVVAYSHNRMPTLMKMIRTAACHPLNISSESKDGGPETRISTAPSVEFTTPASKSFGVNFANIFLR